MLKLLIADDEKYDRDSILSILNAAFADSLEISEAKNGREAIEIAERIRPDIIITDIKMPGINGLKAIQEINKFLPSTYFIILTAYDYFDFAVEAVKNNVKQYILKPFSRTEIIEKIKEAVNFVNGEKEKRRREIENQERFYTLLPILENELSYSIINDTLYLTDYQTYKGYLGLDFKNGYSIVAQLKEAPKDENFKFEIGEYIKEYINHRYKAIGSYLFTNNLVYFIQLKNLSEGMNTDTEAEVKQNAFTLAADIRREVKKSFGVSLHIGIGMCYGGFELLHKSYEEACSALEHKPGDKGIHYFGDINTTGKSQNIDREKVALFKAAEQYIIDNIQEEIDLEKTATKFNLSPYYFSRTFKETLGFNFSDYINIVRINKAKDFLITTAMPIKDVCYLVGYRDPNYFSKVFKKYSGVSPTEFKNNEVKT